MYKVAVIGGDGIGPEVVAEALKVVRASGVAIETIAYDLGAARYERTGEVLPDSVLEELRNTDAILLGAVGPPIGSTSVPPGVIERGLLLRLRFELDLYINLRPFTGVPGAVAPGADFVVVRETPRGPTSVKAARSGERRHSKSPRKARSTPDLGSSAVCALPSILPRAGLEVI